MFKAGEILILTGTPGSGKTTTAQAIAALPGTPKVHLHSDDFWHFIKTGAIPPYLPEAHGQNAVVMGVLARAAESYATGGYFVIVDGIIGPWFLAPFRTLLSPLHYIVLRPDLADALQRCRERGGNTLSDPDPITALHEQFGDLGELADHVLLTDGQSRDDTREAVARAVQDGAYLLT
ncbi:AAA family ATPase [Hyphomicrobium sp.]|uniref:AAA family ATPase n=1 Tax=Hyphomicrobium sp. TaxID=82 RepID=UPI002E3786FF|nr:AAA family ATPase [Hyphomicrobium sp.]HEX2843356.1 AAA family ATPase [Hyphomicrobium sp.]